MGVLRWSGSELYALGASSSVYPEPVALQVAVLRDESWELLPSVDLSEGPINIGADPRLSAWVGDRLVVLVDAGSGEVRAAEIRWQSSADAFGTRPSRQR